MGDNVSYGNPYREGDMKNIGRETRVTSNTYHIFGIG